MPAAHTITPEPVTNSDRGWRDAWGRAREEGEGAGRRGRGQGGGGAPDQAPGHGRGHLPPSRALLTAPGRVEEVLAGGRRGGSPSPTLLSLPDLQNAP